MEGIHSGCDIGGLRNETQDGRGHEEGSVHHVVVGHDLWKVFTLAAT
jgi:hypothetical protein